MKPGADKVLVAMSGGVDSSVTAAMLQEAGYEVTGVFLCLQAEAQGNRRSRTCCSPEDAADAQEVGRILGIEVMVLPVDSAFRAIIDDFVNEYAQGRTPNPCVHCNARIKFGSLFDFADALGARYIATGHYAQLVQGPDGRTAIARAKATRKDQSYALFGIHRSRLDRILLPIGEFPDKAAVRETARRMGLPVHEKPDSQEICFLPGRDHVSLVRGRAPQTSRTGAIVDRRGHMIGRHDGYARFTVGQRRGLGIALGKRVYVTGIEPRTGTVTVGTWEDLKARGLSASRANWHTDVSSPFAGVIQIRYGHPGAPGRVFPLDEGSFEVEFLEPVVAVTPGQAAVVYDGTRLLGGGWIQEARPAG